MAETDINAFSPSHVQPWRLILDPSADGATNMARDEAMLTLVGKGQSPPTIRFYRWDTPTISLGYFQPYADYENLPAPAGKLPVVRRQTGGGAILHDLELTYSIALPLTHPRVAHGRCNCLYDHVHAILAAVLARNGVPITRGPLTKGSASHRGPFFCFERHCHYDLLADGAKLLGSAQRRTANAVLQHGSLVLDCRFDQWACATVAHYAPSLNIDDHLPAIAAAVAADPCEPGNWTDDEIALASDIRVKYAGQEWTRSR